jgi:hypothetical protein
MTHERHHPREDPATTHARLTAAALAAHASACAAADDFLAEGVSPEPEDMPPDLMLTGADSRPRAVIDADSPDERQFTSREALHAYVRTCLVINVTVRRDGWTLPDPEDARIEPDTARLLLRAGDPVIDIAARIGMDGSLDAPRLRYEDGNDRMQEFDHDAHQLDERGIRYIAGLFAT